MVEFTIQALAPWAHGGTTYKHTSPPYLSPIHEEAVENDLFHDHLKNMAPSPILQSAIKHGKHADDTNEEVYLRVAMFILGLPLIWCLLCLNLSPLPSALLLQRLWCHSLLTTTEVLKGGVSLRKEFLEVKLRQEDQGKLFNPYRTLC